MLRKKPVEIFAVTDPEIVRRRGDNKINIFVRKARHSFDAIFAAKIKLSHTNKLAEIVRFVQEKL